MARTYLCLPSYSITHSTSRATSCAMELVVVTDRSYLYFRADKTTAGTMRSAELRPKLPGCPLSTLSSQKHSQQPTNKEKDTRASSGLSIKQLISAPVALDFDDFGDDNFEDQEVVNAGRLSLFYCSRY